MFDYWHQKSIILLFKHFVFISSGESRGHVGPCAVGEPGKRHSCPDESQPPEGVRGSDGHREIQSGPEAMEIHGAVQGRGLQVMSINRVMLAVALTDSRDGTSRSVPSPSALLDL